MLVSGHCGDGTQEIIASGGGCQDVFLVGDDTFLAAAVDTMKLAIEFGDN